MKKLLYKELRLVTHPTIFVFMALAAMMLIPNYPYYVTFFYTTLGIYFTCLTGRENHDIFYTMTLPIRKQDIVKARFLFIIIVEMLQVILCIPFAIIRSSFPMPGNQVGMDANIAFFGFSFILLGIYNFFFFTSYYKDPEKVGACFVKSSTLVFVYMGVVEILSHIIPFMRDQLDTKDPQFLGAKLTVLAIGILLFLILTILSYHRSTKNFESKDL